ncbi:MAG: diacylglycerol kinase family protein [Oscillospiraceae bacterium]|nr:diacylglycerol kinase family protein [Oscillospiraceae bacterium]
MRGFLRGFMFAGRGVWFCIRHERNFRVHMAVAAYVLLLAPYFSLSRGEWAALLAVVALVLAAEAVNTAVEQVVNLASPRRRTRARVAKDVAAGAVLLCAAGALAAGLFLFLRPEAFAAMQADFLRCPWKPALLAASLPLAVWFVICGGRTRRRPKK